MSNTILTVDLVSVGLLLSNCDIEISLRELFRKVEEFQNLNSRIFGTSDEDFSSSIRVLLFSEMSIVLNEECLDKITFKEIIPEMLKYNDVYFNDEGEHWCEKSDYDDRAIYRLFGIDRKGIEAKILTQKAMISFFSQCKIEKIKPIQVAEFMQIQDITYRVLEDCSNLK